MQNKGDSSRSESSSRRGRRGGTVLGSIITAAILLVSGLAFAESYGKSSPSSAVPASTSLVSSLFTPKVVPLGPLVAPGDFVDFNCLNGSISVDGISDCHDQTLVLIDMCYDATCSDTLDATMDTGHPFYDWGSFRRFVLRNHRRDLQYLLRHQPHRMVGHGGHR